MHWRTAHSIHDRLLAAYGPQGWWPADTPFEVIVGAVLTQNAAWQNVEYALEHLRHADALDPAVMLALEDERLGELIRPSGYFNVKARRLKAVCQYVLDSGGVEGLAAKPMTELRGELLAVKGIGRETADDIVLYAFHHPVFVIDAYTRRIFARLGVIDGREGYEELRAAFEKALGPRTEMFQEYHGLIVRHAKEACSARPACDRCCLRRRCPVGTGIMDPPR